jgi:hypothetical protein
MNFRGPEAVRNVLTFQLKNAVGTATLTGTKLVVQIYLMLYEFLLTKYY